MNRSILLMAFCLSVVALVSCNSTTETATTDPNGVAYSFVVVGCNRVDKADTNTTANPSTANLEQFNRTASEVAALVPKPDYFFFAGDMVFGYTNDSLYLAKQLVAWKALYESSPLKAAGIKLVTVPGNHETQNTSKVAIASAEKSFTGIFAPYIVGSNGPKAGGSDSLGTDQSQLTYSFNFKDAHFVVLNTDPVGRDWRVPATWVTSDLAAAKAAGAKHIFAIGHKPAYAYNYVTGGVDGLNKYESNRNQFWSAMESAQADAMFAAHNHVYRRLKPIKTSMIIAGNGGSLLETVDVSPTEKFFGYTLVSVLNNGKVIMKSMGRDIPAAGYMAPAPAATYPTTVRDSAEISWK